MSQKHQIQIHHHHRLDFNACFQVLYFPSTSLLCKLESGFVITYLCIQLGSITHIHISHIYIQLDIQLDTLSVSAVARLQCCFLNQGSWSHIHIQLTNTHTPQFTHFFAPHFRITPKTSNLTPSQCRSKPDWSGVAPHLPALLPQSYQHPLHSPSTPAHLLQRPVWCARHRDMFLLHVIFQILHCWLQLLTGSLSTSCSPALNRLLLLCCALLLAGSTIVRY